MEIKNTTNNLFDPYAPGLDKSTEARNDTRLKARADGTGTEASQGDKVTVSQDALLLTEARRAAQSAPDVRSEKVEALRIQVANGTYKPDSKLIAANLVREEPGLFKA